MKPIGRIVTNKKSIPENFRQVEIFTTEYLSKLWKIYTINRDVLDKGRRLENLFWRIWGSERIQRTFSGKTVSTIFLLILEGEEGFEGIGFRIPPLSIPAPPHPPDAESTPRPSLEIECPPTPPPSPIPPMALVKGFQPGSSYLANLPLQRAITASLHQAFPPGPPSPPPPPPSQAGPPPGAAAPRNTLASGPSGLTVPSRAKKLDMPSSSVSSENELVSSEEDTGSRNTAVTKGRRARAERPPRGRRKGIAPIRVVAVRKPRPSSTAVPRQKSSSSSNTAVSSPSQMATEDVARSLPSSSARQLDKASPVTHGAGSEGDTAGKKRGSGGGDTLGSGWVVDPDFRTKYLERKRREKLAALMSAVPSAAKSTPTVAIMQNLATATTTPPPLPSVVNRGKGKTAWVVDGVARLKGFQEEELEAVDADRGAATALVAAVGGEGIDQLPATLMRRKSELTLLFEEEKKAESKKRERGTVESEVTR